MSVHLNGWKLDRRLGAILMVWYFLFIALASMYELNVFGNFNPPQCPSKSITKHSKKQSKNLKIHFEIDIKFNYSTYSHTKIKLGDY